MRILTNTLLRVFGPPLARVIVLAMRLTARRCGVALVYHGIDARGGAGERELVPAHSRRLFEAQLRHLRRSYRLVPASALAQSVERRRRGERFPVAITFDDDLLSHVRIALPVLQRLGVPATFFLCGASLERPDPFWWEDLQRVVDRGLDARAVLSPRTATTEGEAPGEIHRLASTIRRLPPDERDAVAARLRELAGPEPADAGMRSADVNALAHAGLEIGFHTLRHDYLPSLDHDALQRALRDGRERLEELAGARLMTIAYPHGGVDADVADAARQAGFDAGFTTKQTPLRAGTDPLLIGRIEPSFASAGRLALNLVRTLTMS